MAPHHTPRLTSDRLPLQSVVRSPSHGSQRLDAVRANVTIAMMSVSLAYLGKTESPTAVVIVAQRIHIAWYLKVVH